MFTKKMIAAALAASMIVVPTTRATADTKDVIVGAIVGGAIVAGVSAAQKRKQQQAQAQAEAHRAQTVKPRVSSRSYKPKARRTVRATPKRPSIPATQEGRTIQTSLNYFGFDAGTVDGRVGNQTKRAVSGYQSYMGYPATGVLSAFEQHVLTQTYLRAEAGGDQTFRQIAQLPEGTRGLLKLYRQELAGVPTTPRPLPSSLPAPVYQDL